MNTGKTFRPDRILDYFRAEWLPLTLVTLSGLFYNVGLLATPWFEGRLAGYLADILGGNRTAETMAVLVLGLSLPSRSPCRRRALSSVSMCAVLPTISIAA